MIIPVFGWKQVDGDMNPSQYGATIAKADGHAIELLKIQPVREYVGDGEALEVGHPFWTREAYYYAEDLSLDRKEVQDALGSCGLDVSSIPEEHRAVAIACALLDYGSGCDEGPAGWARDVLGDRKVEWWGRQGKRPMGWRYIADEDVEFRRMQREARKAS